MPQVFQPRAAPPQRPRALAGIYRDFWGQRPPQVVLGDVNVSGRPFFACCGQGGTGRREILSWPLLPTRYHHASFRSSTPHAPPSPFHPTPPRGSPTTPQVGLIFFHFFSFLLSPWARFPPLSLACGWRGRGRPRLLVLPHPCKILLHSFTHSPPSLPSLPHPHPHQQESKGKQTQRRRSRHQGRMEQHC